MSILHSLRKRFNIPTRSMRKQIRLECEQIYHIAQNRRIEMEVENLKNYLDRSKGNNEFKRMVHRNMKAPPFTEHDIIVKWVSDIKLCVKSGFLINDMGFIRQYTAEGLMKAFRKAKKKELWKDYTECDLPTLRKYLPSIYDK